MRSFDLLVNAYLLTYLLTYSMEQSPSWEANLFAASQEIPRILWNPKVHYRTHKHYLLMLQNISLKNVAVFIAENQIW